MCEFHDFARDLRLGGKIHGRVGMLPIAFYAEPLEFLALHLEPVLRVGAALLAERDHCFRIGEVRLRFVLSAVEFLLDLPLDRQPVAVPARHVIGIGAEHLLASRHHVLEDLVERVADVDVAVGVGRAVVEDEFGAPARGRPQPFVEVELLPAGEDLRLLARQPGAHGKVGLGQK